MNRIFRNTIFYLLIFLVIIGIVSIFNNNNEPTVNISQDQFFANLDNGQVKSFTQQPVRNVYEIRGQLKNYDKNRYFLTYVTSSDSTQARIDKAVADKKVEKSAEVLPAKETSGWVTFF